MKIAVVASAWHFPLHFFEMMAAQQLPKGWTVDLFCVSHRDPEHSAKEKEEYLATLGWDYKEVLDKILYREIATVADIERLGWKYMLRPNLIGDFGNTNQWLEEYDYKEYDFVLATHDDNLILSDQIYMDLLVPKSDWIILTNSTGSAENFREFLKVRILKRALNVRGSFEFMKTELIDMIGGKFDMSGVTLTREGETTSSRSLKLLNNWNMTTVPFRKFLDKNGLAPRIKALSKNYRVSDYCIEGERGMISSVQHVDKRSYYRGLAYIQKRYEKKPAFTE
jgi:hypothetical protein